MRQTQGSMRSPAGETGALAVAGEAMGPSLRGGWLDLARARRRGGWAVLETRRSSG
jgi:hypothetical protein